MSLCFLFWTQNFFHPLCESWLLSIITHIFIQTPLLFYWLMFWLVLKHKNKKINNGTTLSSGFLGSRNDEERSEMRYVMRIAEFNESSNLWTQVAVCFAAHHASLSIMYTKTLLRFVTLEGEWVSCCHWMTSHLKCREHLSVTSSWHVLASFLKTLVFGD